jgi:hypothetical protein
MPARKDQHGQLFDERTVFNPTQRNPFLDPLTVAGVEEGHEADQQRPESFGVGALELQPVPGPCALAEMVGAGDRSSIARPATRNPIAICGTVLDRGVVAFGRDVTEL